METQDNPLDQYPEFKYLVQEIVLDVCYKIETKTEQIKSDVEGKNKFVLSEVIKKLQKRI